MEIVLKDIQKSFGDHVVLDHLSARIPAGKVTAIMAPSGKGKTTLLRILMGLETMDSGSIEGLSGLRLSAVFQEDRLCENLTPIANIRLTAPERTKEEVLSALGSVGLGDCARQPVRELSGGMKRRVAILRALLADYDVLILDEPFKGLDEERKRAVVEDTKRRSKGKTVLLVTHDKEEVAGMEACGVIEI